LCDRRRATSFERLRSVSTIWLTRNGEHGASAPLLPYEATMARNGAKKSEVKITFAPQIRGASLGYGFDLPDGPFGSLAVQSYEDALGSVDTYRIHKMMAARVTMAR
jgi:hypothetical protein